MSDPLQFFSSKFSTDLGREEILNDFSSIDESEPSQADRFFEKYGGGYYNLELNSIPHTERNHVGRITAYLDLFNLLKENNHDKYKKIHKGTPYCIVGWLFIDIGDYEQGLFYIDAAISEDIRIDPFGWQNRPAYQFMFLDVLPGNDIAKRFTKKVRSFIQQELNDYNSKFTTKSKHLTVDLFVKNFVAPKFQEMSHRTLISALYVFIFEAYKLKDFLKYRSDGKGSIEPFLGHLHKGSLILESVFKEIYTSHSSLTMGSIINDSFVRNDLSISLINTGGVGRTLEDIIKHLLPLPKRQDIHNSWITIALKLRNATSHSLLLPDVFTDTTYKELYQQILFSVFYLIKNKY